MGSLCNSRQILRRKLVLNLDVSMIKDSKTQQHSFIVAIRYGPRYTELTGVSFPNVVHSLDLSRCCLSSIVSTLYDVQIPKDIVSIVFDEYLAEFQWTYSEKQLIPSVWLDREIANNLVEFHKDTINPDDLLRSRYQLDLQCFSVQKPNELKDCGFLGIGIRIQIDDDGDDDYDDLPVMEDTIIPNNMRDEENGVNQQIERKYPRLFKWCKTHEVDTTALIGVWTQVTPNTIENLCELYDIIDSYNGEYHNRMELDASLLITEDIRDKEDVMIVAQWKIDELLERLWTRYGEFVRNPADHSYDLLQRELSIAKKRLLPKLQRTEERVKQMELRGLPPMMKRSRREQQSRWKMSSKQRNKLMRNRGSMKNKRRNYHRW